MKLKTTLICAVVTAGLVGGVGYGAYYAMQGKKKPVEVVPVSNVNTGYWGMPESIYGSVTSQVAQNVRLNEEYPVAEVFVKEGQEVKEGTPLFSYDMTLPELELEMEKLSLQTQELTLTKLEKDLQKLKVTGATASLEMQDSTLTSSSDEEPLVLEETDGAASEKETQSSDSGEQSAGTDAPSDGNSGLQIDAIEAVEEPSKGTEAGAPESEKDPALLSAEDSVKSYELLVTALDELFQAYGEELTADEIEGAVHDAAAYYRKNLADEKVTQETGADGTQKTIREYVLKDSVCEAIGADAAEQLKQYAEKMNLCHGRYVDMLIEEAQSLKGSALKKALNVIAQEYDYLCTKEQDSLVNRGMYAELQDRAQNETETETEAPTETEPGTEAPAETETEAPAEPGTEAPSETEDGEENVSAAEYVNAFLTGTERLFMEGAERTPEKFRSMIDLYQQYLGAPAAGIADLEMNAKMEEYEPNEQTAAYLASGNGGVTAEELQSQYQTLCMEYVKYMVLTLDPRALTREAYEASAEAYANLGTMWQSQLEEQWQKEQSAAAGGSQIQGGAQKPFETGTNGKKKKPNKGQQVQYPALYDYLAAYHVVLLIQEVDQNQPEEALIEQLSALAQEYQMLTEQQKALVWNMDKAMKKLLKKYGLWIEPEQPQQPELPPNDGWDDGFGDYWGDDSLYTAEELKEMIEEKEQEIKECKLDMRETELSVNRKQRIVDGKVVKSTLDGVVVSIGDADGSYDSDYFVKVTNQTGLFAKGVMNELALEKIKIGDKISGMSMQNGMNFTAVIKEISEYPDPNGAGMSYGSENTNASYYPFYALIENPEGMEEGEAEIQLSETMTNMNDAIYLEKFFVRTDNDGRSYVYMEGEDQKLTKHYITTGKTVYNYAIEIRGGLKPTDKIAFPYGNDVVEGADTKEVDMLQDAYM